MGRFRKAPWWAWTLIGIGAVLTWGYAEPYLRPDRAPDSPIVFGDQPWPVLPTTVPYGDPVRIAYTRCNHADEPITYRVTRNIKGTYYEAPKAFDAVDVTLAANTCERGQVAALGYLPVLPPGVYIVYGVASYRYRGHEYAVDWATERFKVMEP